MCALLLSATETLDDLPATREPQQCSAGPEGIPRLIKTEANLLRLPLFALHTKGLKSLDGIECRGRTTRSGQTHQFTFRATRNTASPYPGPLARSAHLAFLSIITEAGLPCPEPITWTWRDLCRRMGVVYGGQMAHLLRDAINATAGLMLHSEYAVYDKPGGRLLTTQQEALHLYDRVAFVGTILPNGRTADGNYLWLSDWYRANLNAMFTAPLDYNLWRFLDERSPIASRLYEFLLLNFYSGIPVLRINYETLVQFLPIKAERYLSSAQRQLHTALQLLASSRLLQNVHWADSRHGLAQLHLYRGNGLPSSAPADAVPLAEQSEELLDTVTVKELRNLKPPDWVLVTDFYRLWTGDERHRPSPKELTQARELLTEHGPAKAKAMIPLIVKKLKVEWPEARTFGAVPAYVQDALTEFDRAERKRAHDRAIDRANEEERSKLARDAKEAATRKLLWASLPETERTAIREAVLATQPRSLLKHAQLFERMCLLELGKRQVLRQG